jgi:hypothetical protein
VRPRPGGGEEGDQLGDVPGLAALAERARRRATSRVDDGDGAVRRVSMKPGAMALTVMPRAASCGASALDEADDARLAGRVVGLADVAGDARDAAQADDAGRRRCSTPSTSFS